MVHYLVDLAKTDAELSSCMFGILQKLDNPEAASCVALKAAELDAECEGTAKHCFWTTMLRRDWDALQSQRLKFSDDSKDAVLKLFVETDDKKIKRQLLNLWLRMSGSIEGLKKLPQDIFDSGDPVWRRARLGDHTATDIVLQKLKTDKHWFYVVPPIWSKAFLPAVDDALGELALPMIAAKFDFTDTMDHRVLAETLRDIPRDVARNLLCKHWEGLQYSRHFLQIAIYIGGNVLVENVSTTLSTAPTTFEPFKLLSCTFGFNTAGLADRLSVEQFESLEPFLDKLDESAFYRVLMWIERRGFYFDSSFAKYKEEAEKRSSARRGWQAEHGHSFSTGSFPNRRRSA